MKLEVELRSLRLARPLHTAYGAIAARPLVLIALKGGDGISGYGEAAPLQPYDGVSVRRVCAALKRHAVALQSVPNPENIKYLRTKRERMGHLLDGLDDVL